MVNTKEWKKEENLELPKFSWKEKRAIKKLTKISKQKIKEIEKHKQYEKENKKQVMIALKELNKLIEITDDNEKEINDKWEEKHTLQELIKIWEGAIQYLEKEILRIKKEE